MKLLQHFREGTYRRLRRILLEAPWNSYDLLSALIVSGIGLYLWLNAEMFQRIGGVYQQMADVATERQWGILFMGCGGFALIITLWCVAPQFLWRLSARMATAFCLLVLAGNNLLNFPPPLSAVTYVLLSAWALWGVVWTNANDR